jgi:carboxyl-terminal processing protease
MGDLRKPLRAAVLVALALLGTGPARADLDAAQRTKVFNIVWGRVRDKHFDPTLGGLDWNAVRWRYVKKIADAPDDAAYYRLLNEMLGELKQSHFGVAPPDTFVARDSATSSEKGGVGETGTTLSLVEGVAVVVAVVPGGPAAQAGLRPGWEVTAIDAKPVAGLIEAVRALKHRPAEEAFEVRLGLRRRLAGPVGESVRLTCRTGDGAERVVTIVRGAPPAAAVTIGNLPAIPAEFESRRLAGGVGYIRFSIFFIVPLLEKIQTALRSMADAPGIVIDLRGNPGGFGAMAIPIAAALSDQPLDLGTMKTRDYTQTFRSQPQPPRYGGPVAILIDEASLSTSEILAGGLQESGRALIVGQTTGGMVLPSIIETLPGGARLQYAYADFKTPKGVLIEGRGVTPDIQVILTRAALLASDDPTLDAALLALKTKRKP